MMYLLRLLTTVVVAFGRFGSATVHEQPFNLTVEYFILTPYFPFPDFYFDESRLNTFDGCIIYTIPKKSGSDVISLDAENFVITDIGAWETLQPLNYTVDDKKLHVYLPPELVNETLFQLRINYTGLIYTDREEGFYVTEYPDVDAANFNKLYVGDFRSDNLRFFVPYIGDTDLSVDTRFGIIAPTAATVIFNTNAAYSHYVSHDQTITYWKFYKPMLLNQFTFVIGNLSSTETRSHMNIISHNDHMPQLQESLEFVAACYEAFSDLYYKNAQRNISVVAIPSIAKLRAKPNMVLVNNNLLKSNPMDAKFQWTYKMANLCSGVAKAILADRQIY